MRIILFTGKGGVGKTTTAAATGVRLARRGVKTLLLSTDTAHSLADALDTPLTGEPTPVAPSLWALQIDTQHRFEAAWRDVQRYLIDIVTRSGVDPVTADELTVLPGIDEVLALLAVRELAERGDWDALVVDCAPTAETLRLLALPEALSWYLTKVFPVQRRIARSMRPLAGLLGRGDVIPKEDLFEALVRLSDDLAAVRALLGDPDVTSVRLVLTPESVVVAEARRTFTALALYGYGVDLVIANRVFPASGGDDWRSAWVAAQSRQLEVVDTSFAGLPVRRVPYGAGEPVGIEALDTVAEAVYPDALDPLGNDVHPELLTYDSDGTDYRLTMRLPLAEPGSVEAARAGDDLVVTVAGHRRVITLPAVLQRCTVVAGGFDGTHLTVRFRPDPRHWPDPDPGRPNGVGQAARDSDD